MSLWAVRIVKKMKMSKMRKGVNNQRKLHLLETLKITNRKPTLSISLIQCFPFYYKKIDSFCISYSATLNESVLSKSHHFTQPDS